MPNGHVAGVKALANWLSIAPIVKDTAKSIAQLAVAMVSVIVDIVVEAVHLGAIIAMAEEP